MTTRSTLGLATALLLTGTAVALAQNTPGPINPNTANPQTKQGGTIVVNPTEVECQKGWNPTLRWTKEQFEEFCSKLGTSK